MQLQSSTPSASTAPAIDLRSFRRTPQETYPDPGRLGYHASQALIQEAELTPKPGLVDRRGPGAHHDLSLELFVTSARVLEGFFQGMAEAAQGERDQPKLRTILGKLGRDAESEMLKATHGANTHRGAIWSLGLLTAGAAMQVSPNAGVICEAAGRLARLPDPFYRAEPLQKRQPCRGAASVGARGEACSDFPHVRLIGIPVLRQARAVGVPEDLARIDALLAIMSTLHDTCILRRGGASALSAVQEGAMRVALLGGSSTFAGSAALRVLERTMLQLWVSPGGSADLLAATLLIDRLTSIEEDTL